MNTHAQHRPDQPLAPFEAARDDVADPEHAEVDTRDRRAAIKAGLLLGAGVLLAGCASSSSRSTPAARSTGSMSAASGAAAGRTPPASSPAGPAFKSYKPAWLDSYNAAPATTSIAGVMPRRSWAKFGPNPKLADPMGRVSRITIHHDGMNAFTSTDQASAARRLENIRRGHVGRGWADIGYHYVIDPAGRVWEARPTSLQGAHVRHNNPGNVGVMVMGNYNKQAVSHGSQRAIQATLASLMRQHRVPTSRVYTHQELVATACPGTSLQRYIAGIRRNSMA